MIILKSSVCSKEKLIGNQSLNAQSVKHLTLLMNTETVFLNHAENGTHLGNVLHVTQDLDLNQRLKSLNAFLTASILMKKLLQENAVLLVLTDSSFRMLSLLKMKMNLNVLLAWQLVANTVSEKDNAHIVIHSDTLTMTQAVN